MNRFELWALVGVLWWVTATFTTFVLYAAWIAATDEPGAWLVVGLILPAPVVAGVAAYGITRAAREEGGGQ